MGKGNQGDSITPSYINASMPHNQYFDDLFDRAMMLDQSTRPLRDTWTNKYFMPVLQGNYNVSELPGYAPGFSSIKSNYENLYNQARGNILGSTPRGGALSSALAQNEYQRARNIGDSTAGLTSQIIGDIMNKSYDYGLVKAPAQSMAGMGMAAGLGNQENIAMGEQSYKNQAFNAQQNLQAQAANQAAANQGKSGLGALGTGIGSLLGMATAPFTGGTSLIGSAMSGLSGLGKGGVNGVTSGLGGYSKLMNQATPLSW